jgi:hypothetical protein
MQLERKDKERAAALIQKRARGMHDRRRVQKIKENKEREQEEVIGVCACVRACVCLFVLPIASLLSIMKHAQRQNAYLWIGFRRTLCDCDVWYTLAPKSKVYMKLRRALPELPQPECRI